MLLHPDCIYFYSSNPKRKRYSMARIRSKIRERHLFQTTATAKGHPDQERQGFESTKIASHNYKVIYI